jgi:hypothetical protein
LNLVELVFLVLPFEWWMPRDRYERLNDTVMGVIYFPVLLVTAYLETRSARKVRWNQRRGEADDDTVEEWEQFEDLDMEGEGWTKKVEECKPNVETDAAVLAVKKLSKEVKELKELVEKLSTGMAELAANG